MNEQEVKTLVDKMVDRFLAWKLPKTFYPDCGIRFTPPKPSTGEDPFDKPGFWPVGTNLLNVIEARQMIEHLLGDALDPLCNCKWLGIETAPNDGTSILLYSKSYIADGIWDVKFQCWAWPYMGIEPTHWMPLYADPKLAEEKPND